MSRIDKINEEFTSISEKMESIVTEKLEAYKLKIEDSFDSLTVKATEQSKYLQERIVDINTSLKTVWAEQAEVNSQQIEEIASNLRAVLDENIKLTAVDYVALKNKLGEFAKNIESNNQILTQDMKAQLDDITKYIDSLLDIQSEEYAAKQEELKSVVETSVARAISVSNSIKEVSDEQLKHAQSATETLTSLSELSNTNNSLIQALDILSREQHDELVLKEDAILESKSSNKVIEGRENIINYFRDKKLVILMGVMADKNYQEMLSLILPYCKKLYTVKPDNPRALPAEELASEARKRGVEACPVSISPEDLQKIKDSLAEDDVFLMMGSLYMYGDIVKNLSL